jgi:hypothetical protein
VVLATVLAAIYGLTASYGLAIVPVDHRDHGIADAAHH